MSATIGDLLFTRVGTTALYRPAAPGPGERLWFLRWRTDDPRPQIPLTEMWQAEGTPPAVGDFVFFDVLPPESAAPDVERALRAVWTIPPVASSFAWVKYAAAKDAAILPSTVSVQTRLALTLDASNRPIIEADTLLALPRGTLALGFAAGAPVIGSLGPGGANGFVITYPPLTGADPPRGQGLLLPITGPAVGCVCLGGLVTFPGSARRSQLGIRGPRPAPRGGEDIDETFKALVRVQIDPLHPFDPARTFQTFTGRDFLLRRDSDGLHLIPASPVA
jgi:hypothetical protein